MRAHLQLINISLKAIEALEFTLDEHMVSGLRMLYQTWRPVRYQR